VFASLSTLTRTCRTAIALASVFRRPRRVRRAMRALPQVIAHLPMDRTAVPAFRRHLSIPAFARLRSVRFPSPLCEESFRPARQLALPTGGRLRLSTLPFRRRFCTGAALIFSMRALRRHSGPRLRTVLSDSRSSEDLGARITSRLSTLAIRRHFRAHVRACFCASPEATSSVPTSCDSLRPRQLRGSTHVHTRVLFERSSRSV
jgi:hypothetical protein